MKTLSLIGKGPGYERAIQDQEEGADVWCPSTVRDQLVRVDVYPDKLFQLHTNRVVFEPWLREEGSSVVLIQKDALFPDASILPAQELIDIHGFRFGSTLAWAMAWAIVLGYQKILLHGIHMGHETEYGIQRDSLFYFVGYAEGKGVKVSLDSDSGIFIGDQKYGVAI